MNDDIEKIEKIAESSLKTEDKVHLEPDKARFDSLMDQNQQPAAAEKAARELKPAALEEVAGKPNFMDEVAKSQHKVEPINASSKDLASQTQNLAENIEKVRATLVTQPTINDAYGRLLRNRLTHIDDNVKIALSKAGVEFATPAQAAGTLNPVERFLGTLSHAQFQLEGLGTYLEQMSNNQEQLSPANMMSIQIKVTHIQQELEFFTNLLNKALESTKTIMNVQV